MSHSRHRDIVCLSWHDVLWPRKLVTDLFYWAFSGWWRTSWLLLTCGDLRTSIIMLQCKMWPKNSNILHNVALTLLAWCWYICRTAIEDISWNVLILCPWGSNKENRASPLNGGRPQDHQHFHFKICSMTTFDLRLVSGQMKIHAREMKSVVWHFLQVNDYMQWCSWKWKKGLIITVILDHVLDQLLRVDERKLPTVFHLRDPALPQPHWRCCEHSSLIGSLLARSPKDVRIKLCMCRKAASESNRESERESKKTEDWKDTTEIAGKCVKD